MFVFPIIHDYTALSQIKIVNRYAAMATYFKTHWVPLTTSDLIHEKVALIVTELFKH